MGREHEIRQTLGREGGQIGRRQRRSVSRVVGVEPGALDARRVGEATASPEHIRIAR